MKDVTKAMHVVLHNGSTVDLESPNIENLTLISAASALSKTCRFAGNTSEFYSVARHQAIGAECLMRAGRHEEARAFLLHDMHEVIIGDMIKPVCEHLGAVLNDLKKRLDRLIEIKYGVDFECFLVKGMDAQMLYYEWKELMPTFPETEGIYRMDVVPMPDDLIRTIHAPNRFWRHDRDVWLSMCDKLGLADEK